MHQELLELENHHQRLEREAVELEVESEKEPAILPQNDLISTSVDIAEDIII